MKIAWKINKLLQANQSEAAAEWQRSSAMQCSAMQRNARNCTSKQIDMTLGCFQALKAEDCRIDRSIAEHGGTADVAFATENVKLKMKFFA